jgi:hypothetical protein
LLRSVSLLLKYFELQNTFKYEELRERHVSIRCCSFVVVYS